MKKIIGKYTKITAGYFFPLLFVLNLSFSVLFGHAHSQNGLIVFHWHIYQKDSSNSNKKEETKPFHTHTTAEICAISALTKDILTSDEADKASYVLKVDEKNIACTNSIKWHNIFCKSSKQLRAPPIFT